MLRKRKEPKAKRNIAEALLRTGRNGRALGNHDQWWFGLNAALAARPEFAS